MSHAANNYVKKLKRTPNGAEISTTERALLWYLADGHNEEQGGFHFAGTNTLAEHCGIGARQLRRVVSSLEEKGVIARIYARRTNGSHTVNRYVFPALGYVCVECNASVGAGESHPCVENGRVKRQAQSSARAGKNTRKTAPQTLGKPAESSAKPEDFGGKLPKNGAKAVEKVVDSAAAATAPSCHGGHEGDVAHDSTPLSPATGLTTNLLTNLSTNSSSKTSDDGDGDSSLETTSKAKTARVCANPAIHNPPTPPHPGKWDTFKAELLRKLEKLPEKIREGCIAEFNAAIRDTSLIDDACDGDSMVPTWTVSAVDPESTRRALAGLASSVKAALWKTAKSDVQVQVYGGEE